MDAPWPDFTCWPLAEVQAALAADSQWANLPVRIVETAPPAKKTREPKPGRAKAGQEPKREFTATRPGEWRVLRARRTEGEIELLVAREELRAEVEREAVQS